MNVECGMWDVECGMWDAVEGGRCWERGAARPGVGDYSNGGLFGVVSICHFFALAIALEVHATVKFA